LAIVKLPAMSKSEMDKLIKEQLICRMAFKGDEYPYIAPFQYVFMNNTLYFHFTDYGRKMQFIEENKRVCVEIEQFLPDLSVYNFVILRGSLKVVEDANERAEAIRRMSEAGRKRLSRNFLAAHGFGKGSDWSSLAPENPVVIIKLEKITEQIGLKSPQFNKRPSGFD
jgi:nitroimidazol reductase NimA-like FMN-containing flavoprotein (pyridoxamine 5'-phosphate oxidase superfamily)